MNKYFVLLGENPLLWGQVCHLRELGYKVDIEMEDKKLKKSLDYCNKEKIPYVIVLGKDEVTNKSFKLKNMYNRKEYEIGMKDIKKTKEITK